MTIRGTFRSLPVAVSLSVLLSQSALAQVFINEIHYDNADTDVGEAIEVAGPAGTDLTGWSLVLYNGSTGVLYNTTALAGMIADQQGGFGTVALSYPTNGIQNGSPDGIALVDGSSVVQFLSYEGAFTAVGGPANGMTSTDIVASESSSTPVGFSLQLTGTGNSYADFAWIASSNTFGAVNTGQTFAGGPSVAGPKINEFSASTTGTDVEYVEIFGSPNTDYSAYAVLELEGDSSSNMGAVDEVISLGTTDANGFYHTSLPANALENGTISLLLVENFTGASGDDLDTDNDGTFDAMPWDAIVDAVSVNDGGSGDLTYGVPALGPNYDGVSSFAPGGASRIPDGFDTNAASDWVRNDFDLAGIPGYPGSIGLGEAYNTPGAANEVYVAPPEMCGDEFTPIYTIQGSGLASSLDGSEVSTEGVVVGDFQDGKSGFFLQDATGDGDASTSDGIFVFSTSPDVNVGDHVRVRGTVDEFFNLTEITSVSQIWSCSTGNSVAPTTLSLPVTSLDDFEPYEGMLVTLPQALVISEYFNFDRFGEIVLTTERQFQPTATYEPGSPEAAQLAVDNSLSRITLDDGRGNQNPDPAIHPNGSIFDLTNLFRGGDKVQDVTGALDYNFGLYKIQPTQGANYTPDNPRPVVPDAVGGTIKVASLNVLNYFTTIDDGFNDICGPLMNLECRGADDAGELTRQRDKLIAALAGIDADVVGLVEIENDTADAALDDLVTGLNDVVGTGSYDYVATGPIGTDAIRVALIYKPGSVSLVGDFAILDSSVDGRFIDDKNRPVLAQSFADNAGGGIVTIAVNHLKSKGSPCDDVSDPDTGDGSGNCNLTRTAAAEALVDWLATDPTGSGTDNFLVIGDLNAYDKEDPIDALVAGGYIDLINSFLGEAAYSYVFDGQIGYLDHALANATLNDRVTGVSTWHINADEPDLIDYDTSFKQDAQDAIYAPDAYRSSDHDPVIVGLDLCEATPPQFDTLSVTPEVLWPANHKYVDVTATVGVSDNFDPSPAVTLVSVTSNEPDNGKGDGNTVDDIVIVSDYAFQLRAERSGRGTGRTYTITYEVTDSCGNSATGSALVSVPLSQSK